MHDVFMLVAFFGLFYGAYALYTLASFSDAHRDEVRRKDAELAQQILGGGFRVVAFRLGQPLWWLVSLPIKSVLAALGVAFLLILPALVTG